MKKIILLFLCLLISIKLIGQNDQKLMDVEVITSDHISIRASLVYPDKNLEKYPAIILIHQGGSSKEEWFDLNVWDELVEAGYALIAYDIRMHGKSGKDVGSLSDLFNNPNRAPLDLMAVIQFLEKDKHIDANRIGILGASIGANLACVAAAEKKYPIKSAVSISAKTSAVQNLSGKKEKIIPKNVFYIASENDQNSMRKKWANELYSKTIGHRKVEIANGDKHGSFILREPNDLDKHIVHWFQQTL